MPTTISRNDPRVLKAIDSLVPDLEPAIEIIEASLATTQNHYGRYMTMLIGIVPDSNAIMVMIVSQAMIKAGANPQGVNRALRIMGHVS